MNQIVKILMVLLLSGCAGVSTVGQPIVHTSPFRLTSVKVVWIDSPEVRYRYFKQDEQVQVGWGKENKWDKKAGPIYIDVPAKISEEEQLQARRKMNATAEGIRVAVLPWLQERLTPSTSRDNGGAAELELVPVELSRTAAGGRAILVKVSLRNSTDRSEMWTHQLRTNGPSWDDDAVLAKNFGTALLQALKQAGWVN